jgi:hypothetical protein
MIPAIGRAELKGEAVGDTTLVLALAVVHIAAIASFGNAPPVVVVAKLTLAHISIGPSHMFDICGVA